MTFFIKEPPIYTDRPIADFFIGCAVFIVVAGVVTLIEYLTR